MSFDGVNLSLDLGAKKVVLQRFEGWRNIRLGANSELMRDESVSMVLEGG